MMIHFGMLFLILGAFVIGLWAGKNEQQIQIEMTMYSEIDGKILRSFTGQDQVSMMSFPYPEGTPDPKLMIIAKIKR